MSGHKINFEEAPRDIGHILEKPQSAQDQYYKFMLRQEKLKSVTALNTAEKFLQDEEVKGLSNISEREKLLLKTLGRLYAISDLSPDYLQVKSVTGGKDREEIAERLVDKYLEREVVKLITNQFVGPTGSKKIITSSIAGSKTKMDAFNKGEYV